MHAVGAGDGGEKGGVWGGGSLVVVSCKARVVDELELVGGWMSAGRGRDRSGFSRRAVSDWMQVGGIGSGRSEWMREEGEDRLLCLAWLKRGVLENMCEQVGWYEGLGGGKRHRWESHSWPSCLTQIFTLGGMQDDVEVIFSLFPVSIPSSYIASPTYNPSPLSPSLHP